MYGLRNLPDKHPNIIAGAIMGWVNFGIIQRWVTLSPEGVSALNLALVLTLGLFIASKTTNTAVLSELSDHPPTLDGVALSAPTKPVTTTRKR